MMPPVVATLPRVPLRLLVVEDDQKVMTMLQTMLPHVCKNDVGEMRFVCLRVDAENVYHVFKPDIVLFDINLPDGNGFALVETVRTFENAPHVALVCMSSDEKGRHFDEAIRSRILAYLEKPFTVAEIRAALQKAIAHVREYEQRAQLPSAVLSQTMPPSVPELLAIKTIPDNEETVIQVRVHEIMCVEAHKNYVCVHCYTTEGTPPEMYSTRATLAEFEDRLKTSGFVRAHRSFLVNLDYIERMTKDFLTMRTGKKIPVAEKRRAVVREALLRSNNRGNKS
jgi:DNA-binding LytR/AlgR family response regulator